MTALTECIFVTDLHGDQSKYEKLFALIRQEKPSAVFIGGDIIPSGIHHVRKGFAEYENFVWDYLAAGFEKLKDEFGKKYPEIFIILGNDDGKFEEPALRDGELSGFWKYIHMRWEKLGKFPVCGYNYVPPSPFMLKDWEKYDVSRYCDPGCVSPEEGRRSVEVPANEIRYTTIEKDLIELSRDVDLSNSVWLFHTPPYNTDLDRAALDDKIVDHVKVDVHVGSIAVERFIKKHQPLLTLHGHIHESTRLTGNWKVKMGETWCFNGAHDGPELAVIKFNLKDLSKAQRILIQP